MQEDGFEPFAWLLKSCGTNLHHICDSLWILYSRFCQRNCLLLELDLYWFYFPFWMILAIFLCVFLFWFHSTIFLDQIGPRIEHKVLLFWVVCIRNKVISCKYGQAPVLINVSDKIPWWACVMSCCEMIKVGLAPKTTWTTTWIARFLFQ